MGNTVRRSFGLCRGLIEISLPPTSAQSLVAVSGDRREQCGEVRGIKFIYKPTGPFDHSSYVVNILKNNWEVSVLCLRTKRYNQL